MGLKENLRDETVGNLPLREAVLVEADTTVKVAVDMMRAKKLGCAIVVNQDGEPTGMFSESGLIDVLLTKADSLDREPVINHLDKHWASVKVTAPISDLLSAMESQKLRFVCVTDKDGKAIALSGQKGLMEYVAEHFPNQAMVQRLGGTPAMSKREGA